MAFESFVGQLLLLCSPTVAAFGCICWRDPRFVIFAIGGAFWWILSELLASVFWYIVSPMHEDPWFTILCSVLIQELCRFLFVRLVKWFDRRMMELAGSKQLPDPLLLGLSSGIGSGFVYALMNCASVLVSNLNPGAVYTNNSTTLSLYTSISVSGMLFSILHILWGVLGFMAYFNNSYISIFILLSSHLGASYFTLIIKSNIAGGWVAVCFVILIDFVLIMLISLKSRFICRKKD